MKLGIKVSSVMVAFYLGLLYVLMRPFLTNYVTPLYKYLFILIIVVATVFSLLRKGTWKKIGSIQMILCFVFFLYALINALYFGGSELFGYTLERYVFYTTPVFIFAFYGNRIKWDGVLAFLSWFGVVDSLVSIIEFVTRRQMFPMSSESNSVEMITSAGARILRTYGLNGNYFLLAEILCVCGLASYFLYMGNRKKRYLFSFLFICIGIFTTGSRGYYVAFAVAIAFSYLYSNKKKGMTARSFIKTVSLFILVFAVVYFLFFTDITFGVDFIDTILDRVRMITDWTGDSANSGRIQHWISAIEQWKENWLFGNGACCTDTRYSLYTSVTESGILKRLVELGLVGTVLQYLTMFVPLVQSFKRKEKLTNHAMFFYSVLVCFFIEDMVLQQYTTLEFTIITWVCLAVLAYTDPDKNRGRENTKMKVGAIRVKREEDGECLS